MRTAPFSDGTPLVAQWPLGPGEYFDYELRPQVGDAGTYWYHSHVGFQASTAHGVIVVEEEGDPPYAYDDEFIMTIGEFYAKTDSQIESDLMSTPFKWPGSPQALIFNGRSGTNPSDRASDDSCKQSIVTVQPDTSYRIRFITMCALAFTMISIDGHSNLTIIEADGRYTRPAQTDHIQFGSGERFSAILATKTLQELESDGNNGLYEIYYHTPSDGPRGLLAGTAILQYDMSGSPTKAKRNSIGLHSSGDETRRSPPLRGQSRGMGRIELGRQNNRNHAGFNPRADQAEHDVGNRQPGRQPQANSEASRLDREAGGDHSQTDHEHGGNGGPPSETSHGENRESPGSDPNRNHEYSEAGDVGGRESSVTMHGGPVSNHGGPQADAHERLPGQSGAAVDNSVAEWMAYTLTPLDRTDEFPTRDQVTRTLYVNVTTDTASGGSITFQ
jgi:FtsP/CotA-like multicopper oxidase with cupredoxin domain